MPDSWRALRERSKRASCHGTPRLQKNTPPTCSDVIENGSITYSITFKIHFCMSCWISDGIRGPMVPPSRASSENENSKVNPKVLQTEVLLWTSAQCSCPCHNACSFQDLEGLTEMFDRMSTGIFPPRTPSLGWCFLPGTYLKDGSAFMQWS